MNKYRFDGEKCFVTATRKGEEFEFVFDSEDYPRVKVFSWGIKQNPEGATYLIAALPKPSRGCILFHRLITSFEFDITDHADRNTFDNRKANLRSVTKSQNNANRIYEKKGRALLPGAYTSGNRFRAQIRVNNRAIHLGCYATQEEAHEVFKKSSIEVYGEFSPYL